MGRFSGFCGSVTFVNPVPFWFFLLRLAIVRNSGNLPNYPLSAFLSQISPKVYSYCSVLSLFDGCDPGTWAARCRKELPTRKSSGKGL